MLEMKVLKIVCPSSTRWLTHEFCFRRVLVVFEPVLLALSQLYHDRRDNEALGVLVQMVDPEFVLSSLMLADMLGVIRPLTVWLQTSPSKADITELSPAVDLVVDKLKYLATEDPELKSKFSDAELSNLKFNSEVFTEKLKVIDDVVESLPIASRLRNSSNENPPEVKLEEFKEKVYKPFILEIAEEIAANIQIDPVSAAFTCLSPKYFPHMKSALSSYGLEDMKTLTEYYGVAREEMHPKTLRLNRSDPQINGQEALQEYEVYKTIAFDINYERNVQIKSKIGLLQNKLKTTLTKLCNKSAIKKLKTEISELEEQINKMSLAELFNKLNVPGTKFLLPNILDLLEMAILCPIGNSTVERLFSFLKLVKTSLRNHMGDGTLDSLLRIKMECTEELEDHHLEELVDKFKYYLIDLAKSGQIRIDI